jgi:L-fuculose-phosphate aldolase
MGMAAIKHDLVQVASHLSGLGFVLGDCGLLTARAGQEIIVTPEGVHRARIQERQLESVRLDGKRGREVRPSSDLWTHLVIYREREDLGAVIFAQPPHATGFAVAGEALDEHVLPEIVLRLGHVPIIRQESGGNDVDSLKPHLRDSQAFILMNRGVITIGNDPWEAAARLELVEHYARVLLLARLIGRVRGLPEAQMARLVAERFVEEGEQNR